MKIEQYKHLEQTYSSKNPSAPPKNVVTRPKKKKTVSVPDSDRTKCSIFLPIT